MSEQKTGWGGNKHLVDLLKKHGGPDQKAALEDIEQAGFNPADLDHGVLHDAETNACEKHWRENSDRVWKGRK